MLTTRVPYAAIAIALRMCFRRCNPLLLASLFLTPLLSAQDDEAVTVLPPLTVEALAPAADQTLSRDDLAPGASASLADRLRFVPGFYAPIQLGEGGSGEFYVRGGEPNHTVINLEGILLPDVASSRGGVAAFTAVDPAAVTRVDVFTGPAAAFQGGGAMQGVLVLTALSPASTSAAAINAELAEAGYARGWARVTRPTASAGALTLGVGRVDTGTAVPGSWFRATRALGGWQGSFADGHARLFAFLSKSEDHFYPDESGGPRLAVIREREHRQAREGGASIAWQSRDDGMGLLTSWYHREADLDSPGVAPGPRDPFGLPPTSAATTFARSRLLGWRTFVDTSSLTIRAGAEVIHEDGARTSVTRLPGVDLPGRFALTRTTSSLLGTVAWRPHASFRFDATMRADHTARDGVAFRPRVALQTGEADGWGNLSLAWARVGKAPSFFALGDTLVGNPDLVSEQGDLWELAWQRSLDDAGSRLRLALFHHDFTDLVDFDPGPPPRLINRAATTSQGAELAVHLHRSRWRGSAAVTWNEATDDTSGALLRLRPRWVVAARLAYVLRDDLHLQGTVEHVSPRRDTSIPTGAVWLDAYTRFDVAATWTASAHLEMTVTLRNALAEDYETRVGVPAVGRRLHAALRWQW